LLIRGGDSEVVPASLEDFVCETMSDCRSVTVPGGHIVMWDAFDETADAILGFLEDSRS
jgi:pimeloyl-ACP methyl ester carboxylesterase